MALSTVKQTNKHFLIYVSCRCLCPYCIIFEVTAICQGWHVESTCMTEGSFGSKKKTSLIPPLFTEVPVTNQESEWTCICVLGVSIFLLSTFLMFDFEIVSTVYYFVLFFLLPNFKSLMRLHSVWR